MNIVSVICVLLAPTILMATNIYIYRPQTKFAKVMFEHLSVSHSVHGGRVVCLSACWKDTPWADNPRSRHPPAQCMLGDTGNKWAVRILLECILVVTNFGKFNKNIQGKRPIFSANIVVSFECFTNYTKMPIFAFLSLLHENKIQ